jgi:dTMP kinase
VAATIVLVLLGGAYGGYEYQRWHAPAPLRPAADAGQVAKDAQTRREAEASAARAAALDAEKRQQEKAAAEVRQRQIEIEEARRREAEAAAEAKRKEDERIAAGEEARRKDEDARRRADAEEKRRTAEREEARRREEEERKAEAARVAALEEAKRKEVAQQIMSKIDAAKSIRQLEALKSEYPHQLGTIAKATQDAIQQRFLSAHLRLSKAEQVAKKAKAEEQPKSPAKTTREPRPNNLSRYSLQYWPRNSLDYKGQTVTTQTPHGRLTCKSNGRDTPRTCSLR